MAETAQGDTLIEMGPPSAVTPTVVWRDDPITPPQEHVPAPSPFREMQCAIVTASHTDNWLVDGGDTIDKLD
jgi:hypothetical protein